VTPVVVDVTPVVVDVTPVVEEIPVIEETPVVVEIPDVEVSPDVEETPMEKDVGYAVILASIGDWKVNVIKEIRAVTGLSLFDAKVLVERAPTLVTSGVSKEEAMKIRDVLTNAGATVDIKI